jgi:hypothetical protein
MSCCFDLSLVPLGGTGCGIEITAGLAFSIGTQLINYTIADPCGCVQSVNINGQVPPTLVHDGEAVYVTLTTGVGCSYSQVSGPSCKVSIVGMRGMSGKVYRVTVPKKKKKK